MSQKQMKRLRKKVGMYDTNLLLELRNEYGKKTNDFDEKQLYKKAKKYYKTKNRK